MIIVLKPEATKDHADGSSGTAAGTVAPIAMLGETGEFVREMKSATRIG